MEPIDNAIKMANNIIATAIHNVIAELTIGFPNNKFFYDGDGIKYIPLNEKYIEAGEKIELGAAVYTKEDKKIYQAG